VVTAVEGYRITGQQPSHNGGDRLQTRLQEQMKMVGNQGPGITRRSGCLQDSTQPFQESVAVGVVSENIAPFDSPTYDVMQGSGRVDSGLSRHFATLSQINLKGNAEFQPRPSRF
jgi:hypothetical protein